MTGAFFIVGPTATGKSELAADVALELNAEIVNADAFQIYEGFEILSAKPSPATLGTVPHHLIGSVSISEEMNADKFRRAANEAIDDINRRGKIAIVAGGSGLYIKALTHGLTSDWKKANASHEGVFVFRDRDELYARINQRVHMMFDKGVVEEVRNAGGPGRTGGRMSTTAEKMIGIRPILAHINGQLPLADCIAEIQRQTRQYAKRQLTWFRNQTNFEPLNISSMTHGEAVKRISQPRQRLGPARQK